MSTEAKVGTFVIICMVLLVATVYFVGNEQWGHHLTPYRTYLTYAGGVAPGHAAQHLRTFTKHVADEVRRPGGEVLERFGHHLLRRGRPGNRRAVVGAGQLSRGETVSKIWEYIKKHKLQDSANKRNINADEKLKPVFGGKRQVSMFEMTKSITPDGSEKP